MFFAYITRWCSRAPNEEQLRSVSAPLKTKCLARAERWREWLSGGEMASLAGPTHNYFFLKRSQKTPTISIFMQLHRTLKPRILCSFNFFTDNFNYSFERGLTYLCLVNLMLKSYILYVSWRQARVCMCCWHMEGEGLSLESACNRAKATSPF